MKWIYALLLLTTTLLLSGCTEKTAIINGVDEREANEIVVFLASKGIAADKQAAASAAVGGSGGPTLWNISVDAAMTTEAMAILNRNGLPRRQGQTLLQLFNDSGLVPTDMQQKIRYQAGLAQQIANTIRQIDGVIDANVQLSVPPEDSTQPITASVYVKHQGILDNPSSQLVTKIKQLVAGSVVGLKLENVTVISDRSRFTDVTIGAESQASIEEEREFVTIWGVSVAKSSSAFFRFIVFLFVFVVTAVILVLVWVVWKCLPFLHDKGGLSYFWNAKPKEEAPKVPEEVEEHKEEPPNNEP